MLPIIHFRRFHDKGWSTVWEEEEGLKH